MTDHLIHIYLVLISLAMKIMIWSFFCLLVFSWTSQMLSRVFISYIRLISLCYKCFALQLFKTSGHQHGDHHKTCDCIDSIVICRKQWQGWCYIFSKPLGLFLLFPNDSLNHESTKKSRKFKDHKKMTERSYQIIILPKYCFTTIVREMSLRILQYGQVCFNWNTRLIKE